MGIFSSEQFIEKNEKKTKTEKKWEEKRRKEKKES